MSKLEKTIKKAESRGFGSTYVEISKQIGKEYLEIATKPWLIYSSFKKFFKDVAVELPKELKNPLWEKDLEEILDIRHSQTIAIAEIGSLAGRYVGIKAATLLGADDNVSSVIGTIVGDYVFGIAAYIGAYVALTSRYYPAKQAFQDSLRMIGKIVPSEFALYSFEAPLLWLFGYIGPNFAATANFTIHTSICTGFAKEISKNEITITPEYIKNHNEKRKQYLKLD